MIASIKKYLFVVFAISCFSHSAIAQEHCSPDVVPPGNGKTSYQSRGDRCEGIYLQPRSGSAYLSLVSFSSWVFEDDMDTLKTLHLDWPDKINGEFKIRAESLRRYFYYRMDTTIQGDKHKYIWDTSIINYKDIKLAKNELTLIGHYVHNIGDGKYKIYMPITVASKEQHKKNKEIDLLFSSNIELTDVWWDLEELDEEGERVGLLVYEEPLKIESYIVGQALKIKIPKPKKPGFYAVNISTDIPIEKKNQLPPTKRFIFYNEP